MGRKWKGAEELAAEVGAVGRRLPATRLRMLAWHWLVNGLAAWYVTPHGLRRWLYRHFGLDVAALGVEYGAIIGRGIGLHIGEGSTVNYGAEFFGAGDVWIGQGCEIASGVLFCTATHAIAGVDRRAGAIQQRPILLGDGCWIGARAVLLPGVRVGAGCVVAAGAVVAHDCEPHGLYAGVPARRIRDLPDDADDAPRWLPGDSAGCRPAPVRRVGPAR